MQGQECAKGCARASSVLARQARLRDPRDIEVGSYPLVVDGEVVVEVDNALGLAQEAAVGGLGPPVQQVARTVIVPSCGQQAGQAEAPCLFTRQPAGRGGGYGASISSHHPASPPPRCLSPTPSGCLQASPQSS